MRKIITCVANDNSEIVSFYATTEDAYDGAELMGINSNETTITAVLSGHHAN